MTAADRLAKLVNSTPVPPLLRPVLSSQLAPLYGMPDEKLVALARGVAARALWVADGGDAPL
jgi:hypothetical protein